MNIRMATIGVAAAVALTSLAVGLAAAADAKNSFSVRGIGTTTCSKYLEMRNLKPKDTEVFVHWMTGFITAYNWMKPDTYDVAPQYKSAGLLRYLDLYCGKNPKQSIGQATTQFVNAIYPKRLKTQ
jgi:hypothetical protein